MRALAGELMMRSWRKHGHDHDASGRGCIEHAWRERAVSLGPDRDVWELCEKCGILRLRGPKPVTIPADHESMIESAGDIPASPCEEVLLAARLIPQEALD